MYTYVPCNGLEGMGDGDGMGWDGMARGSVSFVNRRSRETVRLRGFEVQGVR